MSLQSLAARGWLGMVLAAVFALATMSTPAANGDERGGRGGGGGGGGGGGFRGGGGGGGNSSRGGGNFSGGGVRSGGGGNAVRSGGNISGGAVTRGNVSAQPRTTYNSGAAVRANAGAPRVNAPRQFNDSTVRGNTNRTFSRDANVRGEQALNGNRIGNNARGTFADQSGRQNRQPNLGARFNENNNRLTVNNVTANSAASQVGMRNGDEVVSVGGRNVRSQADFQRSLSGYAGNNNFNGRVPVVVRRNGNLQTLYWTGAALGLAGFGGYGPLGYGSYGYGGYGYGPFGYGYGPFGYRGLGLGYYGSFYGPYRYGMGYNNGYYNSGYGYYDNSYDNGYVDGQSIVTQDVAQPDPNAAFLGIVMDSRHATAAVVRDVYSYSPADLAGLQPGDTISRINDQPISAPADLSGAISQMQPGTKVALSVTGPNPRTVDVALSTRAEAQKALEAAAKQDPQQGGLLPGPQDGAVDAQHQSELPAPADTAPDQPAPPAPANPQ